MDLRGSRTEENLQDAMVGELRAYTKYLCFAREAREAGLDEIADLFADTARNEEEHAQHEFRLLGEIGDTKSTPVSRSRSTLSFTLVIKLGLNSGFTTLAGWF